MWLSGGSLKLREREVGVEQSELKKNRLCVSGERSAESEEGRGERRGGSASSVGGGKLCDGAAQE